MPPKSKRRTSNKTMNVDDDIVLVIESKRDEFIEDMKTFSNIAFYPGISDYARKMMIIKLAISTLRNLGAEVEECYSKREFEGSGLPVILASLGSDESKPTALVYCQLDGTGHNPEFASSAKYMRGRAVIDTASFLIWINMIQAHEEAMVSLPYNFKFCLDPLSRSEVTQLIEILHSKKTTFLSNVSFCFACLSHGINRKLPNIIYGVRGICEFFIKMRTDNETLEDNEICDDIYLDMIRMMNSLVDSSGNILINGINEDVPEITDAERKWFNSIQLEQETLENYFSVNKLMVDKVSHIERIWHEPALIIKGIEVCEKNPKELIGRFSVLTVPNQTPRSIRKLVFNYLTSKWNEMMSENNIELGMDYWAWPWRADQFDEKYKALSEAILSVYGEKPQSILSGSHLPFPSILRRLTEKNVIIFSLGTFYDFHLTKDERISINEYIKCIKVLTRMIYFVEVKLDVSLTAGKKKGKK